MKEYIERDAAIDFVASIVSSMSVCVSKDEWRGMDSMKKRAISALKDVPAADVLEVRHGENIGEDYDAVDQFVCSKCGIELQGWYRVERDMDDGEETHHEYVMRYCPNCGAKVDGGADK